MSSDPLPFIFRQGHTHTQYHTHKHTPYMHKYTVRAVYNKLFMVQIHIILSRCSFNIKKREKK